MRRTPDFEDQINDLQLRLGLLQKRLDVLDEIETAKNLYFPSFCLDLKADGKVVRDQDNDAIVAICYETGQISRKKAEANARAFAASSEMFSVLIRLYEKGEWDKSQLEAIIARVDQSYMGANERK